MWAGHTVGVSISAGVSAGDVLFGHWFQQCPLSWPVPLCGWYMCRVAGDTTNQCCICWYLPILCTCKCIVLILNLHSSGWDWVFGVFFFFSWWEPVLLVLSWATLVRRFKWVSMARVFFLPLKGGDLCCLCSVGLPWWGDSSEYPGHVFLLFLFGEGWVGVEFGFHQIPTLICSSGVVHI